MVIGDQAVLYYGEPRLTRDIDIILDVATPDVGRFVSETHVLPLIETATGLRSIRP